MGNRAVITTKEKRIGVYLQWLGGEDYVKPFLAYCKLKGHRSPEEDYYGWTRLCQVICNHVGCDPYIGLDEYSKLNCDNGDNGVYIIEDWEIVGRKFFRGIGQENNDFRRMLIKINKRQPKHEKLSAKEVNEYVKALKLSKTREAEKG